MDPTQMTDFRELIDLASERLGGSVLYATDDFFAEKENLLKPSKPVWKEHEYTDRGKWMDGWESRRKRTPGHDFAIVRLGAPGVVRGIVVDTAFFRGNYPERCSVEGVRAPVEATNDELLAASWSEILPKSALRGDSENLFAVDAPHAFTHLRFHIYPDGGVARLRVHGEVVTDWPRLGGFGGEVDLAAAEHGAQVLTCSDMFFGAKHNLIMPGRAFNMSDGWETKRRRGPGHDWVIVQLAAEGMVQRVEIDTSHFKGNYPDTASIEWSSGLQPAQGTNGAPEWQELLPRTKLLADTRHVFTGELLRPAGPATHLRLNVYPDGGVARLRVWGRATERGVREAAVRHVNTLPDDEAARALGRCCASSSWVRGMLAARPFASWDAMTDTARRLWIEAGPEQWREAFAAHPRIGEKSDSQWSRVEQAGATAASGDTLSALAAANRRYEERFGHIFIVCASGKSADEMLAIIRARLGNTPEEEIRIAAEEQVKITELRLERLVKAQ
jgi:allantoicase